MAFHFPIRSVRLCTRVGSNTGQESHPPAGIAHSSPAAALTTTLREVSVKSGRVVHVDYWRSQTRSWLEVNKRWKGW